MASLSRALRVAATRPPLSPARRPGLCPLSSGAHPTAEKNVPYQRTLKEEAGPSAAARGPSRPLPSTADVVVIGGGSLGCQTLYHLAKLGVRGALLLERERLTSGTTWHTAGTARRARARPGPGLGRPPRASQRRPSRGRRAQERSRVSPQVAGGGPCVSPSLRRAAVGPAGPRRPKLGPELGPRQLSVRRAEPLSPDRASWGEGRPQGVEGGRGGVLQRPLPQAGSCAVVCCPPT